MRSTILVNEDGSTSTSDARSRIDLPLEARAFMISKLLNRQSLGTQGLRAIFKLPVYGGYQIGKLIFHICGSDHGGYFRLL